MVITFWKNNWLIFSMFSAAIILRLALSWLVFNGDLLTNAGWGNWIYLNGQAGFYENNVWTYSWPTQPPLISSIYGFNRFISQQLTWLFSYISLGIATHHLAPTYFRWFFEFTKWFATALYKDTPFTYGFLISMKLLATAADLVIALVIFTLGKKIAGKKKAVIFTVLFLFLPFGWYISALWGQYDQLMTLLLLCSFLLLYRRLFLFSVICLSLAGQVKPTALFFFPFYGLYFLYLRPKVHEIILSLIAPIFIFILVTSPFAKGDLFAYTQKVIIPKIFNSDRFGLVNHAFNFWQFIRPGGGWSTELFLGIKALYWGLFFMIITNLFALILLIKKHSFINLILALYLVSAGTYLFGTGMVDRYFFPAVLFLLILCFYTPGLLKWWILTSLIFFANLFYTWGFPILNDQQTWKEPLVIQSLSLLQVLVFFICCFKLQIYKNFRFLKKDT